jgi:hypothetical protein
MGELSILPFCLFVYYWVKLVQTDTVVVQCDIPRDLKQCYQPGAQEVRSAQRHEMGNLTK